MVWEVGSFDGPNKIYCGVPLSFLRDSRYQQFVNYPDFDKPVNSLGRWTEEQQAAILALIRSQLPDYVQASEYDPSFGSGVWMIDFARAIYQGADADELFAGYMLIYS